MFKGDSSKADDSKLRSESLAALRTVIENGTVAKLVDLQAQYDPRPEFKEDDTTIRKASSAAELRCKLVGPNPDEKALGFRGVSTFHLADIGNVDWNSELKTLDAYFSTKSATDYTQKKGKHYLEVNLYPYNGNVYKIRKVQAQKPGARTSGQKYTCNSSSKALLSPDIVGQFTKLYWCAVDHLIKRFGTSDTVFGLLGEVSPFLGTARILTESHLFRDPKWTSQIDRSRIALDGSPAIRYNLKQGCLTLTSFFRHGFPFLSDIKFMDDHFCDEGPPDLPPPPYRFPPAHLDLHSLQDLPVTKQQSIRLAAKWIRRAAILAAESLPNRFSQNMYELSVVKYASLGYTSSARTAKRGSRDVKELLRLVPRGSKWQVEAVVSNLDKAISKLKDFQLPILLDLRTPSDVTKAKSYLSITWHMTSHDIYKTIEAIANYGIAGKSNNLESLAFLCDHERSDGMHFCAGCDQPVPCSQITGDGRAMCSKCVADAEASDLETDTYILDPSLITVRTVAMDRFGLHPQSTAQAQFIHNSELKVSGFTKKARKAVVSGLAKYAPLENRAFATYMNTAMIGGMQETVFGCLGSLEILRNRFPKCPYFAPTVMRKERVYIDKTGCLHLVHHEDLGVTINAVACLKMEYSSKTLRLLMKALYMKAIGNADASIFAEIDREIETAEAVSRKIPHENRAILHMASNTAKAIRQELDAL